ncbi:MAG: ROK family protein [Bacteroidetes bacterium]|nr:ROK family protein [Bacteroidota bacterium]
MIDLSMGIDIGGSHITCQLLNLTTTRLVEGSKVRMEVDGNGSKISILNSWVEAIKKTAINLDIKSLAGIGFAMPGPFDYENGVAWFDKNVAKFHNLHGVDIKSEIIQRLNLPAEFPVRFLNDAASFAVGESSVEPASKFNRIIALTLGTGFGTTFIKNGLPVAGILGIPDDGFLYHIPFQKGIADDYFSTRWFLNEYENKTGNKINGVKELVKQAENNTESLELFKTFGKNLGNFLLPWIKNFDADCIILGGNISKSIHLFGAEMENQLISNELNISICPSVLDEDAALIGSARLCDNEYYSKLINTK